MTSTLPDVLAALVALRGRAVTTRTSFARGTHTPSEQPADDPLERVRTRVVRLESVLRRRPPLTARPRAAK